MKVKLNLYKESKPTITLEWDWQNINSFEESVINAVFGGEGKVIAFRHCNGIVLERMDEELEKIITNYFKKKEKLQ
jgi:hypothetical protein